MADHNPANAPSRREEVSKRRRIPMSVPLRRLEAEPIAGFHLHWFREENVPRALDGGYEFVSADEVRLNQRGVANDPKSSGNTDLGSRVTQFDQMGVNGQPQHLVLMKIKEEWWLEDQSERDKRAAAPMQSLFRNEEILGSENVRSEDRGTRYVKTALFQRPTRKG